MDIALACIVMAVGMIILWRYGAGKGNMETSWQGHIVLDQVIKNPHVEYIFKTLIAINSYWHQDKFELYQVIDGYPLKALADELFNGDPNVAFEFLKSDEAKYIAEDLKASVSAQGEMTPKKG